jgi:hypothetical protein
MNGRGSVGVVLVWDDDGVPVVEHPAGTTDEAEALATRWFRDAGCDVHERPFGSARRTVGRARSGAAVLQVPCEPGTFEMIARPELLFYPVQEGADGLPSEGAWLSQRGAQARVDELNACVRKRALEDPERSEGFWHLYQMTVRG